MDKIKTTEGDVIVRDARFAIVAARFNEFIVESLIKGSLRCLRQHGADDGDIEIIRVPGAFEMPVAIDKVAATRRYDGIIALGAVIRGGTPHFEYVAGECVKGITSAGQRHGIPIGMDYRYTGGFHDFFCCNFIARQFEVFWFGPDKHDAVCFTGSGKFFLFSQITVTGMDCIGTG